MQQQEESVHQGKTMWMHSHSDATYTGSNVDPQFSSGNIRDNFFVNDPQVNWKMNFTPHMQGLQGSHDSVLTGNPITEQATSGLNTSHILHGTPVQSFPLNSTAVSTNYSDRAMAAQCIWKRDGSVVPHSASINEQVNSGGCNSECCNGNVKTEEMVEQGHCGEAGLDEERPTSSHSANTSAGGLGSEDSPAVTGSGGSPGSFGGTKSRFRGVSYDRKKSKWRVQIKVAALGKSGVSVGYFDTEEAAARAYDRAAIGLLGQSNPSLQTNFPMSEYSEDAIPELTGKSREEVKNTLKSERIKQAPRRRFTSRQRTSRFMGVGSSNRKNQWQARILVHGKVTHLGYYETEEEAARVYDRISLALHGEAAQTNFSISDYSEQDIAPYRNLDRENLQRALGVKPMDKSSRFRGVSKKKGKWEAKVMVNRRWAYRELFDSEEEAARAYDRALWRLKPKEAASYVNFKNERPPEANEWTPVVGPRSNAPRPHANNDTSYVSRTKIKYDEYGDDFSDFEDGENMFDEGASEDGDFRYEYKPIKGTARSEKMRAKKFGSAPNLAILSTNTKGSPLGSSAKSSNQHEEMDSAFQQDFDINGNLGNQMQEIMDEANKNQSHDQNADRDESHMDPCFVPIQGGFGFQLQFNDMHASNAADQSMMLSGMVPSNVSEPSFFSAASKTHEESHSLRHNSSLGKRPGMHRIHSEPQFPTSYNTTGAINCISLADLLNIDVNDPLPPLSSDVPSAADHAKRCLIGDSSIANTGLAGNFDFSNMDDWMNSDTSHEINDLNHPGHHLGNLSHGLGGSGMFESDDEELLANLAFSNPRPKKMSKSMSMTQLSSLGNETESCFKSLGHLDARESKQFPFISASDFAGKHYLELNSEIAPVSVPEQSAVSTQPLGPLGRPIRRTSTFTSSLATFDESKEEKHYQRCVKHSRQKDFSILLTIDPI